MSPQTKLRIYCMMAVMYKDEHENVISIVAGYVLDNIFSENGLIVLGREIKRCRGWEEKKDRRLRAVQTYLPSASCSEKGHCCLHNY